MKGKAEFETGPTFFTAGIVNITDQYPEFRIVLLDVIRRHTDGDWGDLDEHDNRVNNDALKELSGRLLSSYDVVDPKDGGDMRLWVITDGLGTEQAYTTVLLPDEY
jgi:hypothetical protein